MQVNAINSTQFGNGYYAELSKADIEKAEKLNNILREYNDTYVSSRNGDESTRKNVFGIVTSVVMGAVGIFMLTKGGIKKANLLVENIKQSPATKKLAEQVNKLGVGEKAVDIASKARDKALQTIAKSEKLTKVSEVVAEKANGAAERIAPKIKEIGVDNIVAGATSLGATAYVARTDGNGDGIPDIAEKGVNAYKNAINQVDVLKEFVDLVS